MRVAGAALSVALVASFSGAQDVRLDPALPPYRPVAGVAGVLHGHPWGMDELVTVWVAGFQRR